MSLEAAIASLDATIQKYGPAMMKLAEVANANGAAGATTTTAAAGTNKGGRPPKAKGPTFEEVTAKAEAAKAILGTPGTKEIIVKHGGSKLGELKPEVYAAFIAELDVAVAAKQAEDEGEGDDDL